MCVCVWVCGCVCVCVCVRVLRVVSMDRILYFTNTSLIIIIIKWWDLERLAGCLSIRVCLWKKSCIALFTVILLLSAAVHRREGGH